MLRLTSLSLLLPFSSALALSESVPANSTAAVDDGGANVNPAFAFTYTAQSQNWLSSVKQGDMDAVFVYAGDVEFYCRGSPTAAAGGSPSPADLPCSFTGTGANAFVYYSDVAKAAAKTFKAAGKTVFINFDGRISPKVMSFVPTFNKLSATAVQEFAAATAAHVCGDDNVDGMAWDVEPFNNDQVPFFSELDKHLTACGKSFGVFAFGETFSEEMWTQGLGSSGFLFDSTYDLDCAATPELPNGCKPCQCTPPSVYSAALTSHLTSVMALAQQYKKPYRLMVSGSGTTQLYEELTTSTCTGAGGGPAYNKTCPYTLAQWMQTAVDVFDKAGVKNDPMFKGVGVYGWTTTDGGGFSPVVPQTATLNVLKTAGYLPYANPTGEPFPPKDAPVARRHPGNKCRSKDIKSCPEHFMTGSPMNMEI